MMTPRAPRQHLAAELRRREPHALEVRPHDAVVVGLVVVLGVLQRQHALRIDQDVGDADRALDVGDEPVELRGIGGVCGKRRRLAAEATQRVAASPPAPRRAAPRHARRRRRAPGRARWRGRCRCRRRSPAHCVPRARTRRPACLLLPSSGPRSSGFVRARHVGVAAEAFGELRADRRERRAHRQQLLVRHPVLGPDHAHRGDDVAGVAEHRHRDAAQALELLLVVDRMARGADAPQLGVEGATRGDRLRRCAVPSSRRPSAASTSARGQPGRERLADRGAVDRPVRGDVLHDAHRAVGFAAWRRS